MSVFWEIISTYIHVLIPNMDVHKTEINMHPICNPDKQTNYITFTETHMHTHILRNIHTWQRQQISQNHALRCVHMLITHY